MEIVVSGDTNTIHNVIEFKIATTRSLIYIWYAFKKIKAKVHRFSIINSGVPTSWTLIEGSTSLNLPPDFTERY